MDASDLQGHCYLSPLHCDPSSVEGATTSDVFSPVSTGSSHDSQCFFPPPLVDEVSDQYSGLSARAAPMEDTSVVDHRLNEVYHQSMQSGTLTPLLKEEIRIAIQTRRHREGKSELPPLDDEVKATQYSEETVLKIRNRRERNRVAARKCRLKKKDENKILKKKYSELGAAYRKLFSEYGQMKEDLESVIKDKECLSAMWSEHCASCISLPYNPHSSLTDFLQQE